MSARHENLQENPWLLCPPPNNVLVTVLCDDFRGEYTMIAKRLDYKKPRQGQSPRGFKKGWRWVKESGETLTRKQTPSGWRYIQANEDK